jgi:ADP-L-glycero-D-manno-heptose 6-epimerase
MIVVTGACGFIGSMLIRALNIRGHRNIVAVDKFTNAEKLNNILDLDIAIKIDRDEFIAWLSQTQMTVSQLYHLGARTDTTEKDITTLRSLNTEYSKSIWHLCTAMRLPLIYASSAATYGHGASGFNDDESLISTLRPLNPYGCSKQLFDEWVMEQEEKPPFWAGLKFFNVYGPGEYHKGKMASVIFHAFNHAMATGTIALFKSNREEWPDGMQQRDFIHVYDVLDAAIFLMENRGRSSIYNVGTGQPTTFLEVARNVFKACGLPERIAFVDMPEALRENYQYYTCAKVDKLRLSGYTKAFLSVEGGITSYIREHLSVRRQQLIRENEVKNF